MYRVQGLLAASPAAQVTIKSLNYSRLCLGPTNTPTGASLLKYSACCRRWQQPGAFHCSRPARAQVRKNRSASQLQSCPALPTNPVVCATERSLEKGACRGPQSRAARARSGKNGIEQSGLGTGIIVVLTVAPSLPFHLILRSSKMRYKLV